MVRGRDLQALRCLEKTHISRLGIVVLHQIMSNWEPMEIVRIRRARDGWMARARMCTSVGFEHHSNTSSRAWKKSMSEIAFCGVSRNHAANCRGTCQEVQVDSSVARSQSSRYRVELLQVRLESILHIIDQWGTDLSSAVSANVYGGETHRDAACHQGAAHHRLVYMLTSRSDRPVKMHLVPLR